jgi:hypothetical protein
MRGLGFGVRSSGSGVDASTRPRVYGFSIAAVIVLVMCSCNADAQVAQKKGVVSPEKRIGDLEKDVMKLQREVDVYNLDAMPDNLVLCDKKVPISREDVRERFEREFFQLLENKGQMTLIV